MAKTVKVRKSFTTVFVDTRLWKKNTRENVSKISASLACYWQIGSKSTNHSPITWCREVRRSHLWLQLVDFDPICQSLVSTKTVITTGVWFAPVWLWKQHILAGETWLYEYFEPIWITRNMTPNAFVGFFFSIPPFFARGLYLITHWFPCVVH